MPRRLLSWHLGRQSASRRAPPLSSSCPGRAPSLAPYSPYALGAWRRSIYCDLSPDCTGCADSDPECRHRLDRGKQLSRNMQTLNFTRLELYQSTSIRPPAGDADARVQVGQNGGESVLSGRLARIKTVRDVEISRACCITDKNWRTSGHIGAKDRRWFAKTDRPPGATMDCDIRLIGSARPGPAEKLPNST